MPVISTRRYSSSSYLTPSSTTSSTIGSYRSNYSSTSSSSTSKDLPTSTSRYNFGSDSGYRSSYRSSLTSSSLTSTSNGTTGSYRSRYDFDDDKKKYSSSSTSGSSSSLSTRIGVSKTSSRFNSDTLPPLPPTASSSSVTNAHNYVSKRSLSRSRDQNDSGESNGVGSSKNGDRSITNGKLSLMNDLDFYEKYSPSRYMTKYEISRSRSLSEAAPTPTRDKSPASNTTNNDTPTHTPKSEVCQEVTSTLSLYLSPRVIFTIFHAAKPLFFVFNQKFIEETRPFLINNPLTYLSSFFSHLWTANNFLSVTISRSHSRRCGAS